MAGLVVFDTGGGDSVFTIVDTEMWAQIKAISEREGEISQNDYQEVIGWLICTDPDVYRPKGAPDRQGKVLKEYYLQTFALEPVEIMDIVGVLTLPGG
jgi:hypothetical protein